MPQIPERLVNFRCYAGTASLDMVGMTDVELPKFDVMTENIAGAGIAGEYESIVLGHLKSLKLKLKWLAVTPAGLAMLAPVVQTFDVRGSIQVQDPMLGVLTTVPLVVECRGQVSSVGLGKFEPGKAMGAESEIECSTIRISYDGTPIIEIDKFNFKYSINGVDYLRSVRADLGGV